MDPLKPKHHSIVSSANHGFPVGQSNFSTPIMQNITNKWVTDLEKLRLGVSQHIDAHNQPLSCSTAEEQAEIATVEYSMKRKKENKTAFWTASPNLITPANSCQKKIRQDRMAMMSNQLQNNPVENLHYCVPLQEIEMRKPWESSGQHAARKLFLKKCIQRMLSTATCIDIDRLQTLSALFFNINYLKCSYHPDIHLMLENM